MSDSSREQDVRKAKREAARLLKSASGAAAGRGTGQTKGCVASCVPDADLHPGDDYPDEGMHISPSQSDHAEDKAPPAFDL